MMSEELQSLIDRVQRDGVNKAKDEAARITTDAAQSAEQTIKDAEQRAADILSKAETEAKAFSERSIQTIEHAIRDLFITIGRDLQELLEGLIKEDTKTALSPEFMSTLIEKTVTTYVGKSAAGESIDIHLGKEDQEALISAVKSRLKGRLKDGVTLHASPSLPKGFTVSLKEGQISHDFSSDAIAGVLSSHLRPQLAELINTTLSKNTESS